MIRLKGITWDHPRGYRGLLVASRDFQELEPQVGIQWERHSLEHFESRSVSELASEYDLIVLDHPNLGEACKAGCLLPLDGLMDEAFIEELKADVAGPSLDAYWYKNHLWGLPLDAACQVAAYRPDLLEADNSVTPRTLGQVRQLGSSSRIAIAMRGVHALTTFLTICANMGSPAFQNQENRVVPRDQGLQALETLREVLGWCPREVLEWNSIQCLNAMAQREDLAYCPYVFGYSFYSRRAEVGTPLAFTNIPGVYSDSCAGSTLGGAGLAISSQCRYPNEALALVKFLIRADVQKLIAKNLGQPGRRSSWIDTEINREFMGFYSQTLDTIERAYVRPRYPGFRIFQLEAGRILGDFLRNGRDALRTLDQLEALHRQCFDPRWPL